MEKTQYIRDLKESDTVSAPFLVKFSAVATGKNGKPYLNLILMDKSGEAEARVWDQVPRIAGIAVRDAFVQVQGRCQLFQGRKQIIIKEVKALREDEVDLKNFIFQKSLDPDRLYKTLCSYVASMEDPFYKALAESIIVEDEEVREKIKIAPAAKSVHHAYRTGLLEHVVSITGILDHLASHYGKILDRDLLFLGGFFHDIGKLWELSYHRVTDYTTEGKLIGHLVMGVELMDRKIRELEAQEGRLPGPFPEDKKLLVKHVILSHHGRLEYGSPKRPKVLEALIVHAIDDLDSRVNSIYEFTKNDQTAGRWTQYHRGYDRYFYKPDWAFEDSHS